MKKIFALLLLTSLFTIGCNLDTSNENDSTVDFTELFNLKLSRTQVTVGTFVGDGTTVNVIVNSRNDIKVVSFKGETLVKTEDVTLNELETIVGNLELYSITVDEVSLNSLTSRCQMDVTNNDCCVTVQVPVVVVGFVVGYVDVDTQIDCCPGPVGDPC